MKINNIYLDRFLKSRTGYYYPLSKGLFLSFDNDGYYLGIEMFYTPSIKIDNKATELLSKLIYLGYIDP